jgi:hypothetical protein
LSEGSAQVQRKRVESLDLMKGFLSLKVALSHLGFFLAVPALSNAIAQGRTITFPALLFAFGVGTGLSKRRKPAWPLVVLALTLVVGSVLREAYLDHRIALGIPSHQHAMAGGHLVRSWHILTFAEVAHYADFLQVYVFFLGIALLADRLRRPLLTWNPWLLISGALGLHFLGQYLLHAGITGPGSVLWSQGYRSFQFAPLFALGILVGSRWSRFFLTPERPKLQVFLSLVAKIVLLKVLDDGVEILRFRLGDTGLMWRHGGLEQNIGGAVLALIMLSASADLKALAWPPAMRVFERVGKRTLLSLSIQMVALPLVGLAAVSLPGYSLRVCLAVACWLLFVALIFNWHRVVGLFKAREAAPSEMPIAPVPELAYSEASGA